MPFSLPLCLFLPLFHFSVCICFSSFFQRRNLPFPSCHLSSETTYSCWFMKACIFFCFLNVHLLNVSFCCSLRKHLKSKWYLSFSCLPLSIFPFVPLSFISFSLADGQLARRTAVQQVKNPFTLSSLLFLWLLLPPSLLKQRQILLWPFAPASRLELLSKMLCWRSHWQQWWAHAIKDVPSMQIHSFCLTSKKNL